MQDTTLFKHSAKSQYSRRVQCDKENLTTSKVTIMPYEH